VPVPHRVPQAGQRLYLVVHPDGPRPVPDGAAAEARLGELLRRMTGVTVDEFFTMFAAFKEPLAAEFPWPTQERPHSRMRLLRSPGGAHVAMMLLADGHHVARLWIDGREVAVTGFVEQPHWWSDDRFFCPAVVTPDHPLQDWAAMPGTGHVRGLLICDAATGEVRMEHPRHDEEWSHPMVRIAGDRLQLFGNGTRAADVPDREWALTPTGRPLGGAAPA
jgi:hypothetical protein